MRSATTTAPTTIARSSRIDGHPPTQNSSTASLQSPDHHGADPTCFPPSALRSQSRNTAPGSRQRYRALSQTAGFTLGPPHACQGVPEVSRKAQCFVGGAAKSTATRTPRSTSTEKPRQAKPVLMRSSRALHVSRGDKADPCSMTRPMRCSVRHSKSLSVAPAAMRSTRSRGYTAAALVVSRTAVVQRAR